MSTGVVNLYSTRAHVFQINTETKSSWVAKGDSDLPVTFIATLSSLSDSPTSAGNRELTIIATDNNGETVLESPISAKTVFNKRSQKFGQWTDPNDMIYGLGFTSEAELNDFDMTFQRLKREVFQPFRAAPTVSTQETQQQPTERAAGWTRPQQPQQQLQHQINNNSSEIDGRDSNATAVAATLAKGGDSSGSTQYSNTLAQAGGPPQARRQQPATPDTNNNSNNGLNGNGNRYPRSQSMFGVQAKPGSTGRLTPEAESSALWQSDSNTRDQLEYENERLKQALEESSKNQGVWQSELTNLRTNNLKLTQALQESKANVERWEKELYSLRDENKELRLRLTVLESSSDPERNNDHKADLQKYKSYVEDVQSELRRKENELEELQRAMEELELKANSKDQNGRSDDATSVEVAISLAQKQRFDLINAKLEAKISELVSVQREYAQLADKLYH